MDLDDLIDDCDCCFVCYNGDCIETAQVTINVDGLGIFDEIAFGSIAFDGLTQTTTYSAYNGWTFNISCAGNTATGTLTSGGNTLTGTWSAIDPVKGCCPLIPGNFTSPGNTTANFDFTTQITIEGDGYTGTAVLDGNEFICIDRALPTTPPPPSYPPTFPL